MTTTNQTPAELREAMRQQLVTTMRESDRPVTRTLDNLERLFNQQLTARLQAVQKAVDD